MNDCSPKCSGERAKSGKVRSNGKMKQLNFGVCRALRKHVHVRDEASNGAGSKGTAKGAASDSGWGWPREGGAAVSNVWLWLPRWPVHQFLV